jgi:pyroglutamyl-peptidase
VRILVHPEAVRVNYQTVRKLVPQLWQTRDSSDPEEHLQTTDGAGDRGNATDADYDAEAGGRGRHLPEKPKRIDACIHIGMADPRLYYSIEHRGHRDGYTMPDVDGERLLDEERRRRLGDEWIWSGVPDELETAFDVGDILDRWRKHSPVRFLALTPYPLAPLLPLRAPAGSWAQETRLTLPACQPDSDLRISEDAGRYLCDFIYFSSLAYLYKRNEQRRALFLHVPSAATDAAVAKGKELTIQLIRSLAESEIKRQRNVAIRKGDKIAVELRV